MIKAKAIEKHWKQRAEANAFVKKNYFDTFDSEKDSFLKQKEIFNELYGKRFEKIEDSTKKLILIN